jgi:hypothetical protein
VPKTVRGPTPQAFRRPATGAAAVVRARHYASDAKLRRRPEHAGARVAPSRTHFESGRARIEPVRKPAPRKSGVREKLERNLFQISAALFVVGCIGWSLLIYNHFGTSTSFGPAGTAYAITKAGKADSFLARSDAFDTSTYARSEYPQVAAPAANSAGNESPASIVAREWSRFDSFRVADKGRSAAKRAAKELNTKMPVRLASLDSAAPQIATFHAPEAIPAHIHPNVGAETSLVDFETAPFPYHGMIPGSDRPFLNAGEQGHRGHASFRGRVFWEAETFSDDRVLLHIPPGFDPTRPAVMVVFFHGHGANLARDVRDRQQVPAQITASGANAVLVAPQFAVDAADSSAGKFWEPNGFKRFLDEAAVKLARLYGDPRRASAFANMPIVIVAYSGGFGPTLSVLDRGGVRSRVRGIVLLDALYAGIDTFADWIANNRSTFFVSSYTPHTAHHNAYLEHLLSERTVPYGSELRRNNLQGTVTFLPAGEVSHRDFVNHAWADNPIKDILLRMDNVDQRIQTAGTTASIPAAAAMRN